MVVLWFTFTFSFGCLFFIFIWFDTFGWIILAFGSCLVHLYVCMCPLCFLPCTFSLPSSSSSCLRFFFVTIVFLCTLYPLYTLYFTPSLYRALCVGYFTLRFLHTHFTHPLPLHTPFCHLQVPTFLPHTHLPRITHHTPIYPLHTLPLFGYPLALRYLPPLLPYLDLQLVAFPHTHTPFGTG